MLCKATLCYTQDTSKIPTLPIWYEASGISKVSFLENFDVANGGMSAIAINKNCGETWYLGNGKVDTNNKFCWGRGYWVAKVDFNGDGIADYIDDNRNIFQGVQKDSPPQTKPVATYQDFQMPVPGRQNRYFIDDFNNDGKEDIIVPGLYNLAKILLGNSDLSKMQVATLPTIQNTAYSLQYVVGAWKDTDGKNKIVLYQQTDTNYAIRTEAFFLYEFKINNDLTVEYTALDTTSFKDFKDKQTPSYFYASSFVWQDRNKTEHTLLAGYGMTDIYSIKNNTFQFVYTKKRREGGGFLLDNGVQEVNIRGYARGFNPVLYLYEGNPAKDTLAKAWLYLGGTTSICGVGDINQDGFGDFATIDNDNLKIYLGRGLLNTISDSNNADKVEISFLQVQKPSDVLRIKIRTMNQTKVIVSLFNLQGELIEKFGFFDIDNIQDVVIVLNQYHIVQGFYNLRFQYDGKILDKALIITE